MPNKPPPPPKAPPPKSERYRKPFWCRLSRHEWYDWGVGPARDRMCLLCGTRVTVVDAAALRF